MITIEMVEDVAVFCYPAGYLDVVEEFDDLLDKRDIGSLSPKR